MSIDIAIERRILMNAAEEAPLADIRAEERLIKDDGTEIIDAAISLAQTMDAVQYLLRAGYAVVYDANDPTRRDLSRTDALTIAADAQCYTFEETSREIRLHLTDSGLDRLRVLNAAIRD